MGAATGMSTGTYRGRPQDVTRPPETTATSAPTRGGPQARGPHLVRSVCAEHLRQTVRKPDPTASQTLSRAQDSDLLTGRGRWCGTNVQVSAPPVNRARLGDAEDPSFPSALPALRAAGSPGRGPRRLTFHSAHLAACKGTCAFRRVTAAAASLALSTKFN